MLSCQEDFFISCQGFFQRPDGGFAPHHKRGHHVRKDDHIANGHHRQQSSVVLFTAGKHRGFHQPAFSRNAELKLISWFFTISSVTTNSRTLRWLGRWYIRSSIRSSRIMRSPRAPTFLSSAWAAIVPRLASLNRNLTFSNSKSR